jgi:hypothetical protein
MRQQVSEENERDKPRDLFDQTDRIAKLIRLLAWKWLGDIEARLREVRVA